MKNDTSKLPNDPEKLKKIIAELQDQHESQIGQYKSKIDQLEERVKYLYDKLFGRKSEKSTDTSPQLPLFDMPEPDPDQDKEEESADEKTEVKTHTRKKSGRKPLPPELPRIDKVYDIAEEEKICGCGASLSKIGEEISEKLDIKPAVVRVIRHIRLKYACKCCEGVEDEGATVKIAPVPPQLIPKGIASAGLVAHLLTAKFEDALPFYRQEKQFRRLGVELHRGTMCSWAMKVAEQCQPLLDLLHKEILSGPLINADETTLQVLQEPGRSAHTKSYMWIFRGGEPLKPSYIYQYHPTRSSSVISEFLDSYEGAVQSDGYKGYDFLDKNQAISHFGCWAHARRKFNDADKARGKNVGKPGSTTVALNFIRQLYAIEKKARLAEMNPEEFLDLRQKETEPILEKFKEWLGKKSTQVLPKGLLGIAISYTLNQWHRLVGYTKCGYATPDNNLAENAIRPFVVGRKNWLFAGNQEGARASATIYSLIETAKANKLDTYAYLRYLFEKLPLITIPEDYVKLLPQNLTPEEIDVPAGWSVV